MPRVRTPRALLAAVAAAVLLITSCGSENGLPSPNAHEDLEIKRQELLTRPSIEDTDQRYLAFEADLKQAMTEQFGAEWQTSTERGSAGCKYYSGVGGATHSSQNYFFEPPVTDAEWPQALDIITRIGKKHGFGEPEVVVSRPGDHVIVGHDQYSGEYNFGTAKRTTFYTATGCHLPEKYFDAPPTWQDNVDGD